VEKVPVDFQDYSTEADEWADLIADNRIAELAEIDTSALAPLLLELGGTGLDMNVTGFDQKSLEDVVGQFSVESIDAPALSGEDRAPFQQMTFTLHDSQVEKVKAALDYAIAEGHSESDQNENSNGNALAFICEQFNHGRSETDPSPTD
jgi:hypothetical protein